MEHERIIRIDNHVHETAELYHLKHTLRCFEWCDGDSVDSFVPSASKSFKGFPYWLIVDEDRDLTWRNIDEIVDVTM